MQRFFLDLQPDRLQCRIFINNYFMKGKSTGNKPALVLNNTFVICRKMDGGSVRVDFSTGNYFWLNDAAVEVLTLFECHLPLDAAKHLIEQTFKEAGFPENKALSFLSTCIDEGIVVPAGDMVEINPHHSNKLPPLASPPLLEIFTDMKHVLKLSDWYRTNDEGWSDANGSYKPED